MMRLLKLLYHSGVVALVLVVILTFACSNKSVQPQNDQLINDLEAINAVEMVKTQSGLAKATATATLIANTTTEFELNGSAYTDTFVIDSDTVIIYAPANTWDKTKYGDRMHIFIRAEKWSTSTSDVFYYECSPGGAVFLNYLVLYQPYNNKKSSTLQNLYWGDTAASTWVIADQDLLNKGYVKYEIKHFSKYAIAD